MENKNSLRYTKRMGANNRSLFEANIRVWDIPLLLALSSALLVIGLYVPIVTFKEMFFWKHTFSVLTGVQSLWLGKEFALAVIIFVFSVIFPVIKLLALFGVWFWHITENKRQNLIHFVSLMGKWSMLDVFVVAMSIVITKFSYALNARPEAGIYIFATSIALSIIASIRIESFIRK